MKKMLIKRLIYGYASVRDYIVQEAIDKDWTLILEVNVNGQKETMTLPPKRLKRAIPILTNRFFHSKFDDRSYQLIDFKWVKDKEDSKQLQLEFS